MYIITIPLVLSILVIPLSLKGTDTFSIDI